MSLTIRSFDQIKKSVMSKNYKFFDRSVNLIGERTSDIFTNEFTDMLHVCYYDFNTSQNNVLTIPWTTKAGLYGKESVTDPVTTTMLNVQNGKMETITGTGVLVEGQYDRCWQFTDSYTGWLQYPYFQQVAPLNIYRDGNKDNKIDRGSIYRGMIGLNGHRMSGKGQPEDGLLLSYRNSLPWSIACQGAPELEFKKILPIIREDVKKFGNLFTYSLLQSKDMLS